MTHRPHRRPSWFNFPGGGEASRRSRRAVGALDQRAPLAVEVLESRQLLTARFVENHVLLGLQSQVIADAIVAENPGSTLRSLGSYGVYLMTLPAPMSVETAVPALRGHVGVNYAEPDWIGEWTAVPNDPDFNRMWGWRNLGQPVNGVNGIFDADVDATNAWDAGTGSSTVIAAIVDSGTDYNHPDLAANIWTNTGEISGNGVDDDGNGFIDDVRGWDFADNDSDPMDFVGHGTHVSGTVGAVGNNGIGTVGINWNVSLMPCKIGTDHGGPTTSGAIGAINYAVAMGAVVSNHSYTVAPTQALQDAIINARANNHIVVCAAGNSALNNDVNPSFPSSYTEDNIISVAATDQFDQLASFSNFGVTSVDIGAPGVNIWSTTPVAGSDFYVANYDFSDGTSMASPIVTGAVAFLRSFAPTAPYTTIIAALYAGSDQVASLNGVVSSGGRLNLNNAISQLSVASIAISPTSIAENAGNNAAFITLTRRNFPIDQDLVLDLYFDDTTEVAVPALAGGSAITIPAFQTSRTIAINAVDDTLLDGTQTVTFDLQHLGSSIAIRTIDVTDVESLTLTLTPSSVLESAGVGGATVTVTRSNTDTLPANSYVVQNNRLDEYSFAGTLVSSRVIPWPTGFRPAGQNARDLVVLQNGRIAVYNGTTNAYISVFNPTTLGWQHFQISGLSAESADISKAGIATLGSYVFATDSQVGANDPYGAVRLNLSTGAIDRFATRSLIWRLFVKDVHQNVILEVDPTTGATLNTLPMPIDASTNFGFNNGLAYDGTSLWLLAGGIGNDQIYRLDPDTGAVQDVHHLGGTTEWDGLGYLNGQLYALDSFIQNRIHVYDPTLRQVVRVLDVGTANGINISGGLTGITGPDRLFATSTFGDEIYELNPSSGLLLNRWNSGLGTSEYGLAAVNNQVLVGEFIGGDLKVFTRDGVFVRTMDVTLSAPEGVFALGGDGVKGLGPTPYRYRDISVGLDDKVYVLDQAGTTVGRFDANTLVLEGFFDLSQSVNAISVAADGSIWGAADDGTLYKFSASGLVLGSLATGVTGLIDISQNVTGQIQLSSRTGVALRTNTAFAAPVQFVVSAVAAFESLGRYQALPSGDLIVTLTNSDATELSVPTQVVIPIGQQSVTVPIDVVDDNILDGPITVTVTAVAVGYVQPATDTIDVLDAEAIQVDIAAVQVSEAAGTNASIVTVRRTDTDGPFPFTTVQNFSNTTSQTILDLDKTRSFITVPNQASRVSDLNVTLTLTHTWLPDLDIYLVSPNGTRVELVTDLPSNQSFMTGTEFDDQTGSSILTGAGPYTGKYRPEGSLDTLNGLNPSGIWTLEITDDNQTDFGTLVSWSMQITTAGLAPLVVTLAVGGNPGEVSLNALTVTIPANQTEITTPLNALDDTLLDGTQTATVTAASVDAVGYILGTDSVLVTDVESLTFTISAATVSEAGGAGALTGTLRRFNSDISAAFVVSVMSSDTTELTVPATVTIPAGQNEVTFPINAIDDVLVDGTVRVTITVTAPAYGANLTRDVDVLDLEPSLLLTTTTPTVAENSGTLTVTVTRQDQADISMPMVVNLVSANNPTGGSLALTVGATATIPANQTSVTFPVTVNDNNLLEGLRTGRITASSAGIISGVLDIGVTDVESLSVTLNVSQFLENAGASGATGTVTRSNTNTGSPLVVTLASSDTTEASVPATVTIPAGAASVNFVVTAVNDPDLDGPQPVTITASASGYVSGSIGATVLDHEPPVITGPISVTSEPRPTVTWSSLSGAIRYELWMSNLSSGVNQIIYETGITVTNFQVPEKLGIGRYRVWVRGVDALERPGFWSVPKDFYIDTAPTITAPVTSATIAASAFPEISWTAVQDAMRYELWVNNLTTGAVRVITQTQITTTNYRATEALGSGAYSAWVRAFNAQHEFGKWSVPQTFNVLAAPSVVLPTAGSTFDHTPTYSWSAVAGAASYDVWVSSRTTNAVVYRNQTVLGLSETQPTDLPIGDYTMWVRARAGSQFSIWSAPRLFSIGRPPVIATPTQNAAVGRTSTITWSSVTGSERYELWITNTASNVRVVYLTNLTSTSQSVTLAAGSYRVWVRAVSAMAETTAWSTDVRFTVAAADAPLNVPTVGSPLLASLLKQSPVVEVTDGTDRSDRSDRTDHQLVEAEVLVIAEAAATDTTDEAVVDAAWNTSEWWLETEATELAAPAPATPSRRRAAGLQPSV